MSHKILGGILNKHFSLNLFADISSEKVGEKSMNEKLSPTPKSLPLLPSDEILKCVARYIWRNIDVKQLIHEKQLVSSCVLWEPCESL